MAKKKRSPKPPKTAEGSIRRKVSIDHVIEVGPWGAYWSIKLDGRHIGAVFLKKDAVEIAKLIQNLAALEGGASLRVKNQWGRHSYEETLPRSADPKQSPG